MNLITIVETLLGSLIPLYTNLVSIVAEIVVFRYKARIYIGAILLPVALIVLLITIFATKWKK